MTAALALQNAPVPALPDRGTPNLPIPWRDPSTVSPAELADYIRTLENASALNPSSPDLRTCLGMAYAMNFEVYKSMDALNAAREIDATHFFAQFKFAELMYRLRALPVAEEETAKALNLAGNGWELALARKQLQEIRMRIREGTQKPEWSKPLLTPTLVLAGLFLVLSLLTVVSR